MNTKIITEIIEKLKGDFDDNQLQTIERTICRTLKDKEIIDVVRTQPQTNEEALVSFLAAKKIEGCSNPFYCVLSNNPAKNVYECHKALLFRYNRGYSSLFIAISGKQ